MQVRYRFGSATGFTNVPVHNADFQMLYQDIRIHAKKYGISIPTLIEELIGMHTIEHLESVKQTRLKDYLIEEV